MKKKILMLAIAACLVVLSIAGSSLAYFTDITDDTIRVFTSGNGVNIELTYSEDTDDASFYPGQEYDDKATISLEAESESAYVGAIIELSKANLASIMDVAADADNIPAAISSIFSGLEDAETKTVKYVKDTTNNKYTIYVVFKQALTDPINPATIFSGIQIPAEWGTDEMGVFDEMEIKVTAYAVQTVGFNGADAATTALTSAFDAWKGYSNNPAT